MGIRVFSISSGDVVSKDGAGTKILKVKQGLQYLNIIILHQPSVSK